MDILVVLEENHGSLHRLSKEAIAGAQNLDGNITALVLGANAESLAQELSSFEIDKILVVNHDMVLTYNSDGYTEVVTKVIQSIDPDVIIAGHSYQTRDFMPRVSARLDIPFISDVTMVNGGNYTKQVLNAKLNCTISSSSEKILVVSGYGSGHGVGMSQWGARYMALKGEKAEEGQGGRGGDSSRDDSKG